MTPPPAPPRRSHRHRRRAAHLALAGLIGCALLTVMCAAATSRLAPDTVQLGPPRWFTGSLGGIGPDIHLAGVIALFTLMCLAYAALVRHGDVLSMRTIVVGVLILHGLMAVGPPLLSTDVFSYGAYGRMGVAYGINPYLAGPLAVKFDRWFPFVGAPWVTTPTAYGPVFTALSYGLAGLPVSAAVLAYKLLAVASSLLMIGGVARAARLLGRDVERAVLFVGLNPVLIIYAVGGSHNDLLMLAALAWSIVALLAHRSRTGGGLLVLAVAVKLTGAILLPFALAARREPPHPSHPHRRRVIAGALVVLLVVGVVSSILFGSGPLHLLRTLQVIQANGGRQSIPGFIAWGLGLGRLSHGVVVGLEVLLVGIVGWLIVAVRRGRLDWLSATGWAIVALLATSTFLLPWYAAWLLPFAALSPSPRLRTASLALTGVAMTSL